jgi:hypothetical protein
LSVSERGDGASRTTKGVSPRVLTTSGLNDDVQILWKETTAVDRYVADRAWQRAICAYRAIVITWIGAS